MTTIVFSIPDAAASLAGGLLIGASAALLLLGSGRIAGISGIFGNALSTGRDRVRVVFLLALLATPWLWRLVQPLELGGALAAPQWGALIGAGLLVGVGTQLGNGCTSGHGVCGLANFSLRSLVAVLTFMGVAMITVALGFGVTA
jgi:uncharacterized membrane protein YedE/YeeE